MTAPALSVILLTDTYDAVRNELSALRAQTVRDRLEIVIVTVTSSAVALGAQNGHCEGFHSVTVVECDSLYPLYRARAEGVRRAHAPIVLLAESHAYLGRRHCEALLLAHEGPWAVVGPAMYNANPGTMRSWAGLYMDYGPWVEVKTPGTVFELPGHNSSYKRSILLEYGDQLDAMMMSSPRRHADLVARRHQLYMEPAARTYHLNVSLPWSWIEERFVGGRSYAGVRCHPWGLARRALYAGGAPLIPLVRLARIVPLMRRARGWTFVFRACPALMASLVLGSLGEGLGYAFGAGGAMNRVNEMEVHKESYVRVVDRPEATGVAQQA